MTDQHTPTTEEIRRAYIGEPAHPLDDRVGAEFDRWLAEHDRQVIRACAQALEVEDWWGDGNSSEYGDGDNDGKQRCIDLIRTLAKRCAP